MSNALIEIIEAICTERSLPDDGANTLLKDKRGRDDFGPRLRDWLEASRAVFPEPVRIEQTESPGDHGVDVLLIGQHSGTTIAFQLKSNKDAAAKDFVVKTKAQITDSKAWKKIDLYVIILGCETRFQDKYQFLLNDSLLYWKPKILVLTPGKAAAVWKMCEHPIGETERNRLLSGRTWQRFFYDVKKPQREPEFLQIWPNLTPDQRFVEPREFTKICNALVNTPLTVLIGPPLVGKTYTAIQILWRHYRQGKPVRWIEPHGIGLPNSPIPNGQGSPGFREKVDNLCLHLGVSGQHVPLHREEFITAQLHPDTLVLVEDPFGAEDDDYSRSLRSYNFFDLKACVEILTRGDIPGCRLLLTSRQGLFERWRADLQEQKLELPAMQLIALSPYSYNASASMDARPKTILARNLLDISGKADPNTDVQNLARWIGDSSETPREVEIIIQQLPQSATNDDVRSAIGTFRNNTLARLEFHCRTTTVAERLFLFCLSALSTKGYGRVAFDNYYADLFALLKLKGDAKTEFHNAQTKYWGLFYTLPSSNGIHMEPVHSTVSKGISKELKVNGRQFINKLATSIHLLEKGIRLGEIFLPDTYLQRRITTGLFYYAELWNRQTASSIAESLVILLEESEFELINAVLSNWSLLSANVREMFISIAETNQSRLLTEICRALGSKTEFPFADAWRLYDVLFGRSNFGVSRYPGNHIWLFFILHLHEAPEKMVRYFNEEAETRPELIAYVFGEICGQHWDKMPDMWQRAILDERACSFHPGLEQVLWGLHPEFDACPAELMEMWQKQFNNQDWKIRATAAMMAMLKWEHLSEGFHEAVRNFIKHDSTPQAVIKVLREALGNDKHDFEIASLAVERTQGAFTADLLDILLRESESVEWRYNLAEKLLSNGGEYATAALVSHAYKRKHGTWLEKIGFTLPADWSSASDVVRLAYLWCLATENKQVNQNTSPDYQASIFEIVRNLKGRFLVACCYILSNQRAFLTDEVACFLNHCVAEANPDILASIRRGEEDAQKHHESNSRWLPNLHFLEFFEFNDE